MLGRAEGKGETMEMSRNRPIASPLEWFWSNRRAQANQTSLAGPMATNASLDIRAELERLRYLAGLEPGWDSYDADPISRTAIEEASRLIAQVVLQFDAHPYFIAPLVGGGVQLHWRNANLEIEVEVRPDRRLSYLRVEELEETTKYTEKHNRGLAETLRAIASVVER